MFGSLLCGLFSEFTFCHLIFRASETPSWQQSSNPPGCHERMARDHKQGGGYSSCVMLSRKMKVGMTTGQIMRSLACARVGTSRFSAFTTCLNDGMSIGKPWLSKGFSHVRTPPASYRALLARLTRAFPQSHVSLYLIAHSIVRGNKSRHLVSDSALLQNQKLGPGPANRMGP